MNTASELDTNKVDIMRERFIEAMPQHAGDHQERLDRSQGGQAMSDTPRTDEAECFIDSDRGITDSGLARHLERELNAANERIRRLDGRCQALDDQVCNLLEICRQHGVDVSSQDMINGRRKAKEAKP